MIALARLACLLLLIFNVNALKYPRLRGESHNSKLAKPADSSNLDNIDAILAELNTQAAKQTSPSFSEISASVDSTVNSPADDAPAAPADAIVDTGKPVEVVASPPITVSPPEGAQVPTIEASQPTVPDVPQFPAEPNFPSIQDRLAGPAVRVQANVPADEQSADDMSIEEQEEQTKMDEAIGALNEDLMHYVKQIQDETKWVLDVRKVIETYDVKTRRVQTNIEHLKTETQELYKKKKQIENLKLQKQLELKLRAATGDLTTLEKAMAHVRVKQDEFTKSKTEVMDTIGTLEGQLADLKGIKTKPSKEKLKEESDAVEDQEKQNTELGADTASDD
jgi:predicted DNA-binding protein with PD1-like motif